MDLEIKDKVAMITGAGQGVGRGIALVLAAEGVQVAVNDLFADRAEKVVAEIREAGGTAMAAPANVSDLEQIKEIIGKIESEMGPVDIMVNNAGVPVENRESTERNPPFAGSDFESWKRQIDLNIYGWLNCTHTVLQSMIPRKEGTIVSVISEAGRTGEAYLPVYSGAKAGVLGFTKAIAREVARYTINLNCIAIGATAHEGTGPFLNPDAVMETDPILPKLAKVYPMCKGLGRIGRPYDAASAIAFLASPRACYITGQCLSVSGGFSMVS